MPKIVDHDERRGEYVDALWRVVERDGAAAISHRSVAAEAGMSKSNVAHYFPSRADLLATAVDQLVTQAERGGATLNLESVSIDTVVETIMFAIPDTPKRRQQTEIWLLLIAERGVDPRIDLLLDGLNERVLTGIARQLAALAAIGFIGKGRDIELEASRLHALVDGLSLHTMMSPRLVSPEKIRQVVAAHVADLMRSPD